MIVLAHAFFQLCLGTLLMVVAVTGLEHEAGFAPLGHPGFRHLMRVRVDERGSFEARVIGKDGRTGPGPSSPIDRFSRP